MNRDVNDFDALDYENSVKPRLSIRMESIESVKRSHVEPIHYKTLGDMAFYPVIEIPEHNGVSPVNDKLLEAWGVSPDRVYDDAKANTWLIHTPSVRTMAEVLSEMTGLPGMIPEDEGPRLYVATNEKSVFGSSILFNKDAMNDMADAMEGDFYILPSSVHEVLFAQGDDMSVEELENMIQTINANEVLPEDRLSDHCYKYNSKAEQLEMYNGREFVKAEERDPQENKHEKKRSGGMSM